MRQNEFRLALVKPAAEPITPGSEEKKRLNLDLVEVSRLGFLDRVKKCHAKAADVDATDIYGRTALMYASFSCNTEIMELLISKGADANAQDNDGKAVLEIASRHIIADRREMQSRACGILRRNGAVDYSNESADPV